MASSRSISCTVLLGLLASAPALAQASGGFDPASLRGAALIYGARHALALRSPKGWRMDTESGRPQGLQAVFYPNGERWSKSPAVMYCLVVPRGGQTPDLRSMMEYEQERFRNASATAVIVDQNPIDLAGRKSRAVVRRFSGGANGAFEQVAYVEERTVIVMMVLSCRTSEDFDASLPAFREFVGTYRFLADDAENIQRALEAVELSEEDDN